jgi:hypothetical protein
MAKRDKLILSAHQFIETSRDINGRYFVAYSGGASLFIREVKDLRRFLKIATGIPMRESLESWLASLADMDAARQKPLAKEGLSDELLATGFGPEVHDVDNENTRTVV